ncbi:MAG: universal stress protein [Akkermansiaceae bacterium]|nr:universal stress protein [Akkermansiaceae bacterium]
MKTIVVAVDFSNATEGVLEQAKTLAKAFPAELHLLHVMEPEPSYAAYGFTPNEFPAMHDFQKEAKKRASDSLGKLVLSIQEDSVTVKSHVAEGSPLRCIADYVKEEGADLLVLGSHGHGAFASLLLGSVAEGMVRRALVPTLVVPAPPED